MEINRGDGSLGTFHGVQCGLAMRAIAMLGSEEQKQRWLPEMARVEKIGAFALTEPKHGSDSVALETAARRDGDEYVIDGRKRWIGNGTVADVVVVWARDAGDGQVKGFLVEKGTPGFEPSGDRAQGIGAGGLAGRHRLAGVRVPAESRLPEAHSFKDSGPGAGLDAQHLRLRRAGARGGGLRRGARLLEAADASSASRWAASRSSRSGSSGCSPRSRRCS